MTTPGIHLIISNRSLLNPKGDEPMTILKKLLRPTQTQKPYSQTPLPKPIKLTQEELKTIAGAGPETSP